MQGVGKRDLMLGGAYFWGFTDEWRTPTTEQLDYWTPDNPNAYYPRQRFGGGGNFQSQTKYLQNGAYIAYEAINLRLQHPESIAEQSENQQPAVLLHRTKPVRVHEDDQVIRSRTTRQEGRLSVRQGVLLRRTS